MDFMEGLPQSGGKHGILVVVDRLSKYAHFLSLSHPYTTHNVYKLHGMPSTIISDMDPIFLSTVCTQIFQLNGVALNKSTAYHPQIDGQMRW